MTSILGQQEWIEAKRNSDEQAAVKDMANKSSVSKPEQNRYLKKKEKELFSWEERE